MNDETVLEDIAISGRRAPSSPSERDQYYRLMDEGYCGGFRLLQCPVTQMTRLFVN